MVGAALAEPGVCMTCRYTISDAIRALPRDYAALHYAQQRGNSPAPYEAVSSSKELPIPLSLTFMTLAEQIVAETTAFAEPVAEQCGIDWDQVTTPNSGKGYGKPKYRQSVMLGKSVSLLSRRFDTFIGLPLWSYCLWGHDTWVTLDMTGIEAAGLLVSLHRAAYSILGLTRSVVTMQAQCPFCRARSLVKIAGRNDIKCQACGKHLTEREYEQWSFVLIADKPKRARRYQKSVPSSREGTIGRP
jgi:hypothetical protein